MSHNRETRVNERPDPEGFEIRRLYVCETVKGFWLADGTLTHDRMEATRDRAGDVNDGQLRNAVAAELFDLEGAVAPGKPTPSRIEWLARFAAWGLLPHAVVDPFLAGGRVDDYVWSVVAPLFDELEPVKADIPAWKIEMTDGGGQAVELPVQLDVNEQTQGVRPNGSIIAVLDAMLATGWTIEAMGGVKKKLEQREAVRHRSEVVYEFTRPWA